MAQHVCPVWVGRLLASPFRRFVHNPQKILGRYIQEGMTVLDIGCAMGFFTIPMARFVGSAGKVVCIDLQEKMLRSLRQRALGAGFADRIEPRLCEPDSLCLEGLDCSIDFALVFAVVHEVPDVGKFFTELSPALKTGGKVLLVEPKEHVSGGEFEKSVALAKEVGFTELDHPRVWRCRAALLSKQTPR